jgi:hypothetical protein
MYGSRTLSALATLGAHSPGMLSKFMPYRPVSNWMGTVTDVMRVRRY